MKVYRQIVSARINQLLAVLCPSLLKRRRYRGYLDLNWGNLRIRNSEPELLIARELVHPGDVVFDIGANRGLYTLSFSERLNPKEIYSFEPNPRLHKLLQRLFPQVNHYRLALSDRNGSAEFKIPYISNYEYSSRGTLQTNFAEENETSQVFLNVETIRLDDFVVQNNIEKIALIKIDVEGHEYAVLQGAKQTLVTLQPVLIVEIEQRHHDDIDADDIVTFVRECGYTACYFCWENFAMEKLSKLSDLAQNKSLGESNQYVHNFIFLPDYVNFKDVCSLISEKIKAAINLK